MTMWILAQHDHRHVIGSVLPTANGSGLRFKIKKDVFITSDMLHDIFGNIGYKIEEYESLGDGRIRVIAGTILEWSLEPMPTNAAECDAKP